MLRPQPSAGCATADVFAHVAILSLGLRLVNGTKVLFYDGAHNACDRHTLLLGQRLQAREHLRCESNECRFHQVAALLAACQHASILISVCQAKCEAISVTLFDSDIGSCGP